jgi:hypothetical protein
MMSLGKGFQSYGRRVVAMAAVALMALFGAACNPGPGPTTSLVPPSTASPSVAPPLSNGVTGLVLAGPTCPVERAGQSACVRAVSGAVIVATDATGTERGQATSDSAGTYLLELAPGTYTISAEPVTGLMRVPAAVKVVVPDGPPIRLDLTYDTGIR